MTKGQLRRLLKGSADTFKRELDLIAASTGTVYEPHDYLVVFEGKVDRLKEVDYILNKKKLLKPRCSYNNKEIFIIDSIKDSKIVMPTRYFDDFFTHDGEDEPDIGYLQSRFNVNIKQSSNQVVISGTKNDLKKLYDYFHLEDIKLKIVDSSNNFVKNINRICDSLKIRDIDFKYLTEAEKELKELLGLYKKVKGSHQKKEGFPSEKKSRQNQFNNDQVKDLNEAINDAIRNLQQGERSEKARWRLSSKIEGWSQMEGYELLIRKANSAIKKFKLFIQQNPKKKE